MSLSRPVAYGKLKAGLTAIALAVAGLGLSACSFSPLYGDGAAATTLDLAYAEPATHLDQIVYQELALRLGRSTSVNAPVVTVLTSTSNRRVGRSASQSPATTYEKTVSATLSVAAANGMASFYTVSREATATYTTNGQRLADQQAAIDAEERAAKALGDQFRLLLAAELPGKINRSGQ